MTNKVTYKQGGGDVKKINEVARKARQSKGYTQKQVAAMLGIALRSYQRFEYGERNLSTDKLFQLAEILDVDIYDLAGRNTKASAKTA